MTLAYVREGAGGYPLVLVHGYPETKRIYWRNIEPLVAANGCAISTSTDCSLRGDRSKKKTSIS